MKKAILVDLEPQQLLLLAEVKKKTGASRAWHIRQAIDTYLQRQARKGRGNGRQD